MAAPELRSARVARRRVDRALACMLALSLVACGSEAREEDLQEREADAAAAALEQEARTVEAAAVPTRRWTERREVAEVDAAFPHSDHRGLQCQRCHARPADHVNHTDVACTRCHGRPAGFADLQVKSARECAACHHDPARAAACITCHAPGSEDARPVLAAVRIGADDSVRVRTLTFRHALHAGEACTRCHTEAVTRAFAGDCSTCHDDHHTATSHCGTCHQATGLEAHAEVKVHTGCAGAGCHSDPTVLALEPNRNVCLTCHADLTDHHVDRECTQCHVGTLRSLSTPRGGR